jgi:hypothetical protein
MFRFGPKTAKSKISQKFVKKPTAQTSSKVRPRPRPNNTFFLLNMVTGMMGIKNYSFDADSKKVNLP